MSKVGGVALLALLLFVISMNLSRPSGSTTKISSQLSEQLGLSNSRWGSGGEASVLKEEVTELRKRVKDMEKHLMAMRVQPAQPIVAQPTATARPVEATAVIATTSRELAAATPASSTAVVVAATAVVTTGQRVAPPLPPNTVGMASWWSDQEVQVASGAWCATATPNPSPNPEPSPSHDPNPSLGPNRHPHPHQVPHATAVRQRGDEPKP